LAQAWSILRALVPALALRQGLTNNRGQTMSFSSEFKDFAMILAFIIFMMVKQINRMKRQAPPAAPAAPAEDVLLLREIRDSLKW